MWPAALTPFSHTLEIDREAFVRHVTALTQAPHVTAIVVNGHAGEASSLSQAERLELIALAKAAVGTQVAVISGVIADATDEAESLAGEFERAGADGILLFPPSGFRLGVQDRPDMAVEFVRSVSSATSLPICLFQYPLSSGMGYPTSLLRTICEQVGAVVAVKESSDYPADYERNCAALADLGRPVRILSSNNAWLFASLAIGGDGIISGIGSVAAPILSDIYDRVLADDLVEARAAQRRLFALTEVLLAPPLCDSHTRMKVMLCELGIFPTATVRGPLLPITDPGEVQALSRALDAAGLRATTASR
ncbi:dihydrodipicolinate synthase family protein [Acrocarpospora macrocephala]|uniref:dihydrodipicolinate synthase family protein n=1 Tax=Acrocarpospora macrocephala TaxID=150177 RepID=UPI001C3F5BF8|nr:dihydrodipicolinate synthase family protein [Acrocarpospora macrocephala]